MDATELRALQAPLKQAYRDDPSSAITSVAAHGSYVDEGITATVETWAGPVRAGLHRATGGDGSDACSGDMLMEAVLACAGVTLRSVATALGVSIDAASLSATSSFDARGTLGVSPDAPVGVGDIEIMIEIDTDAPDEKLTRLGELTERYCVVGQSLAKPPRISVRRRA